MSAIHSVRISNSFVLLGRLLRLPPVLLATMACLAVIPAEATTLVRCKIDGRTVYSDTDCPRSTRLRDALPASKPIKITRKTKAAKRH